MFFILRYVRVFMSKLKDNFHYQVSYQSFLPQLCCLNIHYHKVCIMETISRVKQSLSGILKKMKQDAEVKPERMVDEKKENLAQKKKPLVKTRSLIENNDAIIEKHKRRAVSDSNIIVGGMERVDLISAKETEENKGVKNLITFSSEEEETVVETISKDDESWKEKLSRSPLSPRKIWNKVQEKKVQFQPKSELTNIKFSAPNPLQPPIEENHIVAQYRSAEVQKHR